MKTEISNNNNCTSTVVSVGKLDSQEHNALVMKITSFTSSS